MDKYSLSVSLNVVSAFISAILYSPTPFYILNFHHFLINIYCVFTFFIALLLSFTLKIKSRFFSEAILILYSLLNVVAFTAYVVAKYPIYYEMLHVLFFVLALVPLGITLTGKGR